MYNRKSGKSNRKCGNIIEDVPSTAKVENSARSADALWEDAISIVTDMQSKRSDNISTALELLTGNNTTSHTNIAGNSRTRRSKKSLVRRTATTATHSRKESKTDQIPCDNITGKPGRDTGTRCAKDISHNHTAKANSNTAAGVYLPETNRPCKDLL